MTSLSMLPGTTLSVITVMGYAKDGPKVYAGHNNNSAEKVGEEPQFSERLGKGVGTYTLNWVRTLSSAMNHANDKSAQKSGCS